MRPTAGPPRQGVEPLTPTGEPGAHGHGERRLRWGESSRGFRGGRCWQERATGWSGTGGGWGWLPGYRGWRRCRRSQFLDTAWGIGRCAPRHPLGPRRTSRPGPGPLPSRAGLHVGPPTCTPGSWVRPGADEAFSPPPPLRATVLTGSDSSVVIPVSLGYQRPQLRFPSPSRRNLPRKNFQRWKWVPSALWTADTAQKGNGDRPGGASPGPVCLLPYGGRRGGGGAGAGPGWGREGSPGVRVSPRDVQALSGATPSAGLAPG